MPYKRLSTAKIAKAVGCHPNTVRLYEKWGLISPAPRSRSGYRLYSAVHLFQMRLARTALHGAYPGRAIRRSAYAVIQKTAGGDLGGALELAYNHLATVRSERSYAGAAVQLLERWAKGVPADPLRRPLRIREAAHLLGLTPDTLRSWERNGLIDVPRDPGNRYRLYGGEEIGRLRVIRMLRQAGYSPGAILRMLLSLDQGEAIDLAEALDTPQPGEDVYSAADHWLSSLEEHERRAKEMIAMLEEMIAGRQKD